MRRLSRKIPGENFTHMPCPHFQPGKSSLLLLTLFLYTSIMCCNIEATSIIIPLPVVRGEHEHLSTFCLYLGNAFPLALCFAQTTVLSALMFYCSFMQSEAIFVSKALAVYITSDMGVLPGTARLQRHQGLGKARQTLAHKPRE